MIDSARSWFFERLPDAGACLAGHGETQPVRARFRALGRDDLDALPALQSLRQRCQNPVDAAGVQWLPMSVCTE